jgi:hypothetical protein
MKRKTFDLLASTVGLGLAVLLIVAGSLLTWAHSFVQNEVHTQLAAQKIYFPPKGSPALTALPKTDRKAMEQYAGQLMTTGDQAQTYADHFIKVHLSEVANGQTYAQLSAKSLANPNDQKLAGQVQTMFRGETLRGLLLNAYAFGRMATIAGIAAVVAFVGGGVLLLLGGLGVWHSRRVPPGKEFLTGQHEALTPENV